MSERLSTMLAALAVTLFLVAIVAFALGELLLAGFCFFSISLIIFFRETRL